MASTRTLKKDWILTREAFDRFLARLDDDRERAGEKYEILRLKLLKYFEWRNAAIPEELADETINRIARKLHEGETIQNLNGFIFGIARHLVEEQKKELSSKEAALRELPKTSMARADDHRLDCCEKCLDCLSESDRDLIINYYSSDKRARIDEHKRTAAKLAISLNSIRLRIYRIKQKLEKCISECEAKHDRK